MPTPSPKTFTGARAVVSVNGSAVGIISNFSYGVTDDIQPTYILGRYSPAELVYTAQEPVRCTATGWRVYGFGPHVSMKMPRLQDLLGNPSIEITVKDRQNPNGPPVAVIRGAMPESYSSTIASRTLTEITHTFVAMLCDDESSGSGGHESVGATDLPA
jgi:hypothetical protein